MKRVRKNSENEKLTDILKRLTKRMEEATVDVHEMKSDLKFVKLGLDAVDANTNIMKVDIEKMRDVLEKVKKDTDSLIDTTSEMLANMATQKEFNGLSRRVAALEN